MEINYLFLASLTDVLIGHCQFMEGKKSPYLNLTLGELKDLISHLFIQQFSADFKSKIKLEEINFIALECTNEVNEIEIDAVTTKQSEVSNCCCKIVFAFTDENISVKKATYLKTN